MKRILPVLDKLLRFGIPAVIVVGATQHAIEVAEDTYLSLVDIILWLVAGMWGLSVLLSGTWRKIAWPPLFAVLFVILTTASAISAEDRVVLIGDAGVDFGPILRRQFLQRDGKKRSSSICRWRRWSLMKWRATASKASRDTSTSPRTFSTAS